MTFNQRNFYFTKEKETRSKKMFRSIYFFRENRSSCRFCAIVTAGHYTGLIPEMCR